MILLQVGRLFLQKSQQVLGLGVTRVAAGDEHGIDARKAAEDFAPFLERRLHRRRVCVIRIHRRIPDPALEAVLLRETRHFHHHLHGRKREVRAIGRIVGTRRNQLDGVGAEDRQVAYVAFPLRHVPPVVGVSLGPVAQLVAAQGVLRRGLNIQRARQGDRIAAHFECAQQAAHAEQNSALVIAHDLYAGRPAVVEGAQAISFRGQLGAGGGLADCHHRFAWSRIYRG